ncbi:hypothetical protein Pmar_PMAR022322 [Perkinsus marinus ATCC 50983]|uniref:Uncharacterized protein n=1 Tax=Perkinsus marinus (strain ATCC 50983 / TXsc) TaxID=423536 RepID=C5KDS2_PERM5|nr:hypothetical protein Pmar_PMAR022322 [Perkinsus marinus ATCC 50983]EER17375.1 hypothetical protein Pmar_PMAR022322 [Perkinsus marinus ATCC 50983]|eukprot:XP_002785579.1 hypothetical protein Pmar_PMAR022322 [Perkinsus marinus ATCC 50983]
MGSVLQATLKGMDCHRFYLAALKLSPKAEHLWTLLFNAVAAWAPDRDELGDMVDRHDMEGLSAAVGGGVPDVAKLPPPERSNTQGVVESIWFRDHMRDK